MFFFWGGGVVGQASVTMQQLIDALMHLKKRKLIFELKLYTAIIQTMQGYDCKA